MLKYRIAILRKALVRYELSIITKDSEKEISDNLTDIANACKDLTNSIHVMLKRKIKDYEDKSD